MDYENEEAMSSPLWKKWIEDYTSFKIFLKTFCTPTYFASLWWWASKKEVACQSTKWEKNQVNFLTGADGKFFLGAC